MLVEAKNRFPNNQEMQEALDMGIKALLIQIPTKPNVEKWLPTLCPCCMGELSEHMGDGYYKRWDHLDMCPKCGQKLEWGG